MRGRDLAPFVGCVLVTDLPERVATLEQLARDTAATLADIRGELRGMRTDSRADIAGLRTDLRADIAGLRTDLRADIAGLRTELADGRREHRSDFRWLLGIMLAGLAGTLGVMAHGFHWL